MISLRIPEVLAMPERNRAERRRKARACRAIVRSGYFKKHGDIANAAPALQECERSAYTERLRDVVFVFAQRLNAGKIERAYEQAGRPPDNGIARTRELATRILLGRTL